MTLITASPQTQWSSEAFVMDGVIEYNRVNISSNLGMELPDSYPNPPPNQKKKSERNKQKSWALKKGLLSLFLCGKHGHHHAHAVPMSGHYPLQNLLLPLLRFF